MFFYFISFLRNGLFVVMIDTCALHNAFSLRTGKIVKCFKAPFRIKFLFFMNAKVTQEPLGEVFPAAQIILLYGSIDRCRRISELFLECRREM